jgi:hypothetical protein
MVGHADYCACCVIFIPQEVCQYLYHSIIKKIAVIKDSYRENI